MVRERYARLRAAMPGVRPYYAVKANPSPEVLRVLAGLGCAFDVASPAEVRLCLTAGAAPADLSYGTTVKKRSEVAAAYAAGVRRYAVDSPGDLAAVAAGAPGAAVYARIFVPDEGSATPFGRKFGCTPDEAVTLLRSAARHGLCAEGVSFHAGSQQTDPAAFGRGVEAAATVAAAVPGLTLLNIGGGFPVAYRDPVPPLAAYAEAVEHALDRCWPGERPALMSEPGRLLVAEAGTLRTEVVVVAQRAGRRWVYLDAGRYGGLAETENEAIAYRITTTRGGPAGPVVLAGPTCDGDDVLYRRTPYELPLALAAGDVLELHAAGAYTASYASVGFNGIAPLATTHVG